MPDEPSVLHQDDELLVLIKPAGLPTTHPEREGECLVRWAERLDPSAPRLHPSSRLDAEVTGVVIFARSREATMRLLQARSRGAYRRTYVCIVARLVGDPSGQWSWSIGIDPADPRRRVAHPPATRGAKPASSGYRVIEALPHAALLALEPHTGRTHQLRVHAAAAGSPILGDRSYGGALRVALADGSVVSARRVLLHCARVELHDRGGAPQIFAAPAPSDMVRFWGAVGGALSAFDLA